MNSYERTYRAGRAVCAWVELVAWVGVFFGAIAAISGFMSDGLASLFSSSLVQQETPFLLRIMFAVPGLLVVWGGLRTIMDVQQTKASIDTAEMTREMLTLARAFSKNVERPRASVPPSAHPLQIRPGDRIKIYKGKEIKKEANGVSVDGVVFPNILEAERYISDLRSK
ncbi:hypothetical protein [Rhodobium gokarnense]|uniref:Uncharacterized protein n=1 Tax=Rhodobium gokarnense TaxID=364296 RepID=A0ABT3HDD5_9HYPH|nr:hypothetical protein [Rhodobium gokarnense]MCW2308296.1 hypothetical protein [Rhodobium gokarnense]